MESESEKDNGGHMNDDDIFEDLKVSHHPDLEGLTFRIAALEEQEFLTSLHIRNAAMRAHLEKRWVWDDRYQEQLHRSRYYNTRLNFIIYEDHSIGTISIVEQPGYLYISEFYIHPSYQGRGIASAIIKRLLEVSARRRQSLKLDVLLWNPAQRLYVRNGFREMKRDETNITMVYHPRPPLKQTV